MLVAGLPPALNLPVPTFTPGWRERNCESKVNSQENRRRTRTACSGGQRTNREATARGIGAKCSRHLFPMENNINLTIHLNVSRKVSCSSLFCYFRYPLINAVKQALGGGTGPNPTVVPTESTPPPTPNTQPPTNVPPTGSCKATGAWEGNAGMDQWCMSNCAVGNCPPNMCLCV